MSTEQKLENLVRMFENKEVERQLLVNDRNQKTNKSPGITRNTRKSRIERMNEIIASRSKTLVAG
ncbi:hypothetical protein [Glutamicibacter ardleyensis]|uniref:hypothetical protein n=1 Tax=Glutamicibacter ardleyensis TaxID=225894 RepID=UPI003FD6582F